MRKIAVVLAAVAVASALLGVGCSLPRRHHRKLGRRNHASATLPAGSSNDQRNTMSSSITAHNETTAKGDLDTSHFGCNELRSKRYISDGYCTSVKPVTDVVCSGHCFSLKKMPWYAQIQKVWANYKAKEWRCVEDKVSRRRVHLLCNKGEQRSYKIKVVKSCKCKRYNKRHNMSRIPRRPGDPDVEDARRQRKQSRHSRVKNE
ncbi:PREDICTED: sclerostin domain-containing protein 1-like [Priapulus caudatus]|uniref:Sclerostin domain-containing protein 1-like n=1 Tax=Priapulus caudatus TaxID=37621 RepID=A0ABM1F9G4_PRICU|nr:PREDICTED: sclerostin domain-containing protein 1-like [Priapulus caudatus]